MAAEIHSFISDVLNSSGIEDRDGFALRASNELDELREWNEAGIKRAIAGLKTDIFRRNPSWNREEVANLLTERLLLRWPRRSVPARADREQRITVLVVSANPIVEVADGVSQTPLALDEEMREIQQKIRAAKYRDSIDLIPRPAARADDLIQSFNEIQPNIVHFSGHGTPNEELVLLDNDRDPKPVSKRALEMLFKTMRDEIRVVLLNACFSASQAIAITKHIDCAIGMKKEIGDQAAIVFAASFYRALGFGHSVKRAFDEALTAVELDGVESSSNIKLLCRKGVDPSDIHLISD